MKLEHLVGTVLLQRPGTAAAAAAADPPPMAPVVAAAVACTSHHVLLLMCVVGKASCGLDMHHCMPIHAYALVQCAMHQDMRYLCSPCHVCNSFAGNQWCATMSYWGMQLAEAPAVQAQLGAAL